MTATTLAAGREANEARLAALIAARTTPQLLLMHAMATHTFRAVRREEMAEVFITLYAIETELESRGIALCEECGQAGGQHDAAFHDA